MCVPRRQAGRGVQPCPRTSECAALLPLSAACCGTCSVPNQEREALRAGAVRPKTSRAVAMVLACRAMQERETTLNLFTERTAKGLCLGRPLNPQTPGSLVLLVCFLHRRAGLGTPKRQQEDFWSARHEPCRAMAEGWKAAAVAAVLLALAWSPICSFGGEPNGGQAASAEQAAVADPLEARSLGNTVLVSYCTS